jgi:thioredoxin 1
MSNMIELDERNFEQEVAQADLPVLVDFYATWCGPCKMLAPLLDKLAGEFSGRVKFAKVNVDEAGELAMRFGITGVPTLILFQGGQIIDTIVGMMPPASLKARLEKAAVPSVAA